MESGLGNWEFSQCPYTLEEWGQLFDPTQRGVRLAVVMPNTARPGKWKAYIDGDPELIYYPDYESKQDAITWAEAMLKARFLRVQTQKTKFLR